MIKHLLLYIFLYFSGVSLSYSDWIYPSTSSIFRSQLSGDRNYLLTVSGSLDYLIILNINSNELVHKIGLSNFENKQIERDYRFFAFHIDDYDNIFILFYDPFNLKSIDSSYVLMKYHLADSNLQSKFYLSEIGEYFSQTPDADMKYYYPKILNTGKECYIAIWNYLFVYNSQNGDLVYSQFVNDTIVGSMSYDKISGKIALLTVQEILYVFDPVEKIMTDSIRLSYSAANHSHFLSVISSVLLYDGKAHLELFSDKIEIYNIYTRELVVTDLPTDIIQNTSAISIYDNLFISAVNYRDWNFYLVELNYYDLNTYELLQVDSIEFKYAIYKLQIVPDNRIILHEGFVQNKAGLYNYETKKFLNENMYLDMGSHKFHKLIGDTILINDENFLMKIYREDGLLKKEKFYLRLDTLVDGDDNYYSDLYLDSKAEIIYLTYDKNEGIRQLSLNTGEILNSRYKAHDSTIIFFDIDESKNRFMTVAFDSTIKIWSNSTFEMLDSIKFQNQLFWASFINNSNDIYYLIGSNPEKLSLRRINLDTRIDSSVIETNISVYSIWNLPVGVNKEKNIYAFFNSQSRELMVLDAELNTVRIINCHKNLTSNNLSEIIEISSDGRFCFIIATRLSVSSLIMIDIESNQIVKIFDELPGSASRITSIMYDTIKSRVYLCIRNEGVAMYDINITNVNDEYIKETESNLNILYASQKNEILSLMIESKINSTFNVTIVDLLGKQILNQNTNLSTGSNHILLETGLLPSQPLLIQFSDKYSLFKQTFKIIN